MDFSKICFGCFGEKESGAVCMQCGFQEERYEKPKDALPVGTVVGEKYVLGKVLGVGRFGITYIGMDIQTGRKVAVKEYMPKGIAAREADGASIEIAQTAGREYNVGMEQLQQEAKLLTGISQTPHIVAVQDSFQENNTIYFVMEYVDAMHLREYLEEYGGRIRVETALHICRPIMKTLCQIHELNVLHRDISPDNIVINSMGESWLLECGAAKYVSLNSSRMSTVLQSGCAPIEQYYTQGKCGMQGPWTDVYAMAATIYRCITGNLPPQATARYYKDTLQAPSALGVEISTVVEAALLKALEVRTEDRFQSMEAFLNALEGKSELTAEEEESGRRAASRPDDQAKGAGEENEEKKFGGKKWAILLLGIVCVVVILAVVGILRKHRQEELAGQLLILQEGKDIDTPISHPNEEVAVPVSEPGEETELSQLPEQVSGIRYVETDLGEKLNASIELPDNYVLYNDGDFSVQYKPEGQEEDVNTINIGYAVRFQGVPIYSYQDIPKEYAGMFEMADMDFTVTGTQEKTVNGQQVFDVYYESAGEESQMKRICRFVEPDEGQEYGCYRMIAKYEEGNAETEEMMQHVLDSFASKGVVKTAVGRHYNDELKLQWMLDKVVEEGFCMAYNVDESTGRYTQKCGYDEEKISDLTTVDWNTINVYSGGEDSKTLEEAFLEEQQREDYVSGTLEASAMIGGLAAKRFQVMYENNLSQTCVSLDVDGQIYEFKLWQDMSDKEEADRVGVLFDQITSSFRKYE